MAPKFFNTLTRTKEEFKPVTEGHAGIYSCGPTVYGPPHIGNYSSFMFADVLKRYLKYRGFEVTHVMNVTDVDDNVIRQANKEGKSLRDVASVHEKYFLEGLKKVNCLTAEHYPRATEHVEEMIAMIEILLEKGHAYISDGSVYFKVTSFADYGRLANLDPAELVVESEGGRIDSDRYDRENVRDFALWKGWVEEDGDVYWDAPFGRGRPGWHIECSAMSRKYLGDTFDFHTGAVDLIFPHHQNEIAQSECCTGHKFVNYWLHRAFVNFDGEKMAKSMGNVFTLEGLDQMPGGLKGYRYLIVSSHYRAPVYFTTESMQGAAQGLKRLEEFVERLKAYGGDGGDDASELVTQTRNGFVEHMDDDLNAPRAIAAVHDMATRVNRLMDSGELSKAGRDAALGMVMEADQVLGLFFEDQARELTAEQQELIDARATARAEKNWAESDRIRDLLKEQGIEVKDTPDGVRVTFVD